ncbi:cation diffusion facilitator family transporter [Kangiella geojedonensis]|uniref:Cation diffusion facilitator family transporter n=1 Tax=Kangiella geojedonensis TaxID=914150 RepID=A0A0F6TRX5_9GAMM|nr:cation diffusion facilitator family transporter [Kangiella geojedonensis]AKE52832.1 Cation diffusion facilitator family transporter [Kangiella geojedonensis]
MHHHGHSHANDDENHEHPVASRKQMLWAVILTSSFMLVEVVGGIISGSLALLADAGHMLTDSAALLLAFYAMTLSAKPADSQRTFGYGRLQVLAAYTNGIFLIGLTIWIVWESIQRFYEPNPIQSTTMLFVAILGLIVNIVVFKVLHSASGSNINVRSALLHVIGDLLGSVGAIVAALIIWQWGLLWVDPLLSIVVSMLILRSAYHVIKDSSHILLEGKPQELDTLKIREDLMALEGVVDIHHMHLWSISEQEPLMTFHALIKDDYEGDTMIDVMLEQLRVKHGLVHATIQIERTSCLENTDAVTCVDTAVK